ncbi:hypothetical protein HK098_004660 [Nowakowskiella sp. JEL0407]|nr:hypothetical protein HK098_004660 [Nowakowskiella sp. JEL0407]
MGNLFTAEQGFVQVHDHSPPWQERNVYFIMVDRFAKTETDPSTSPSEQEIDYFGWCGGTIKGIQLKLDYISNMGFNAIWITPIFQQQPDDKEGKWKAKYHGYHTGNIYEIDKHFGTKQDLLDLKEEMRKRDMLLMLDIVPNHMGCNINLHDPNWASQFYPFNHPSHYHLPPHYTDPSNPNWLHTTANHKLLESCWFFGLADLNSENAYVEETQKQWLLDLVSTYSIDAFRIDTARFMPKQYLNRLVASTNTFFMGEYAYGLEEGMRDYGIDYIADKMNYVGGALNFPGFLVMREVFVYRRKSVEALIEYYKLHLKKFKTNGLGNFVDNHDIPRFLADQDDISLLMNSLLWTYSIPGFPIVYYGTEQHFSTVDSEKHDPYNRQPLWLSAYNTNTQLYNFIKRINNIRTTQKFWNHKLSFLSHGSGIVSSISARLLVYRVGEDCIVVLNNFGKQGNARIQMVKKLLFGRVDVNMKNWKDELELGGKIVGVEGRDDIVEIQVFNGFPLVFCRILD